MRPRRRLAAASQRPAFRPVVAPTVAIDATAEYAEAFGALLASELAALPAMPPDVDRLAVAYSRAAIRLPAWLGLTVDQAEHVRGDILKSFRTNGS